MSATTVESPIRRWKQLANATERIVPQDALARAGTIWDEINRLKFILSSMLPAETKAQQQIKQRLKELESELSSLQFIASQEKLVKLDLEPLKWRGQDGWPQLILVSPDNPMFQIMISRQSGYLRFTVTPTLPEPILACYADIVGQLVVKSEVKTLDINLASEFTGIFPSAIRATLAVAKGQFERVYIIAEAQSWVLTENQPIARHYDPCPLVVGWKNDQLYLIDSFDLTPLEKYVKSEFSTDNKE